MFTNIVGEVNTKRQILARWSSFYNSKPVRQNSPYASATESKNDVFICLKAVLSRIYGLDLVLLLMRNNHSAI